MNNPITAIEEAMVTRLRLHDSGGPGGDNPPSWPFRVKHIDGYGGQLESGEELAQATSQAPAIFVAYESESGSQENQIFISRMTWAVFVLARSYNPEELRRGGPSVVGLYQLIEAVRLALTNQTLGLGFTPLELQDVRPLWRGGPQGKGYSLAALRFTIVAHWDVPSNIELDNKVCPDPAGVAVFDLGGRGIIKAKSYWRLPDEHHIPETDEGPEGSGPGPDAA